MSSTPMRMVLRLLVLAVALAGPVTLAEAAVAAPATPTNVSAQQLPDVDDLEGGTATAVEVTWAYPSSSTDENTFFEVSVLDASGQADERFNNTGGGSDDRSATIFGLPYGSYRIGVRAAQADPDGIGEPTYGAYAVTTIEVVRTPSAVTGLTAKQYGPGRVELTWGTPATNNDRIRGYNIGYGVTGSGTGTGTAVGAAARSVKLTGLAAGTYTTTVRALAGTIAGDGSTIQFTVTGDQVAGSPAVKVPGGSADAGEKVTVSGTAGKGQRVQLQVRNLGAGERRTADGFTVAATKKANRKGRYTFKRAVTRNVEIRVVNLKTGAVSPSTFVTVAKDLSLKATKVGKQTYRLSGKVAPGGAGQVVKVLVSQNGAALTQVGQATTNRKGAFSLRYTFTAKGKAVVQVVSDASATNAPGSATRTFRVR